MESHAPDCVGDVPFLSSAVCTQRIQIHNGPHRSHGECGMNGHMAEGPTWAAEMTPDAGI